MNITVTPKSNTICEKVLFKVKPLRKDGLFLNIHPKVYNSSKNIRFTFATFHSQKKIVALADNNEEVYIVDYGLQKFWKLPSYSCSSITFSSFNEDELFLGMLKTDIKIVNFETGSLSETLEGHKACVKYMSFAEKYLFLSSSEYDAILWDLRTNTMLQVLDLTHRSLLKYTCFIPMSSNMLACFQDDVIQVWNALNFETIKNLSPKNWKNYSVKSMAFTKNGQIMIVAGYTPILAIFLLSNWKLYKFVNLADYIQSVRHIEFVPQPFDAGFNNILAILANHGVIYFYNFDKNIIISELKTDSEIKNFFVCPEGNYITCLLHCGDTGLYNIHQYTMDMNPDTVIPKKRKLAKDPKIMQEIKYQLNVMLNKEKLKVILEEYGEFPSVHRLKIWEQLLELPNNYTAYNNIINRKDVFDDIFKKYPLENKLSMTALKKLLSNLVTWSPFFANVDFMPVFAFPFIKVFQNKPVACFESICTIIINWCQHWFEYYPLTPFNILAIIENIFYEHDPEILNFFTTLKLSSSIYAWPLLSSAFSEVLPCSEWLIFWDHVFSNEVSFLICATAAYNIIQRDLILKIRNIETLKCFYQNQNPIDIKKLLRTSYFLLNNISENLHPRQYLRHFKGIEAGSYPVFKGYPILLFDLKEGNVDQLQINLDKFVQFESDLVSRRKKEERKRLEADQKVREHDRRIKEMEEVLLERIKSKERLLKEVSSKLVHMKNFVESTQSDSLAKIN